MTPLDPVKGGAGSVKPSYTDEPKSGFAPRRKFRVPSLLPEPRVEVRVAAFVEAVIREAVHLGSRGRAATRSGHATR